ncbi:MucR family transcriptional regulator [Methylobacterium sp. SI9]|uniref:MucR family transcriptional regulator n=1 Tax=Methylobacterium guangdongense TaxID=3138811 RepID=UPI00313B87C6
MRANHEYEKQDARYADITVTITSAYVSKNHLAPAQLPQLISDIHSTLRSLDRGLTVETALANESSLPTAVDIRQSIRAEALTSFIDGRAYRTLKRHLTAHGFSPQSYRARFGLPADYPMIAQDYTAKRSALAKAIGLGVPSAQVNRQAAE